MLFGLAVSAGVDWVSRAQSELPRGVIAALIVLGSAGAIVGFFVVSGPVLATQSRELQTKLPEAIDKIDAWVQQRKGGFLELVDQRTQARRPTTEPGPSLCSRLRRLPAPTGAAPRTSPDRQRARDGNGPTQRRRGGTARLRRCVQRILGQLAGLTRYLFGFLSSTISVVARDWC